MRVNPTIAVSYSYTMCVVKHVFLFSSNSPWQSTVSYLQIYSQPLPGRSHPIIKLANMFSVPCRRGAQTGGRKTPSGVHTWYKGVSEGWKLHHQFPPFSSAGENPIVPSKVEPLLITGFRDKAAEKEKEKTAGPWILIKTKARPTLIQLETFSWRSCIHPGTQTYCWLWKWALIV